MLLPQAKTVPAEVTATPKPSPAETCTTPVPHPTIYDRAPIAGQSASQQPAGRLVPPMPIAC